MSIFGTFSYWFTNRYDVSMFSIEYIIFFIGILLVVLTDLWYTRVKNKEEKDDKEILDIIKKYDNGKKKKGS